MGWTHSWRRKTELSPERFAAAVEDCVRVLGQVGIALAGPDGTGDPVFRPEVICFNGVRPTNVESFEIHQVEFDRHGREVVRGFCKTERSPYDLCVQLCLIVMKQHLKGEIDVASDGKQADWRSAVSICQKQLGYGDSFELSR